MHRVGRRAACVIAASALTAAFGVSGVAGATGLAGDGGPSAPKPIAAKPSAPTAGTGSALTWRQALDRARRAGAPIPADPAGASTSASARIVPAASRTVSVTPATGLVSGQALTVSGSGFGGVVGIVITECRAAATGPDGCDLRAVDLVAPDGTGAFTLPFQVHRNLRTQTGSLDCAGAAGACELIATDFMAPAIDASAPLTFDATKPAPNPSITVTPATGILDGHDLTVTGTGFDPGLPVGVGQCLAASSFCEELGDAVAADGSGGFSTTLTAHLRVTDDGGQLTNCLVADCIIRAAGFGNPDYAAARALAFDPGQPVPPDPSLTVSPHSGLLHRQSVTISGTGFDAGADVELSECGPDDVGFCFDFLGEATVGTDGTFTASVSLSRLVTTFGPSGLGSFDCATGGCAVGATEYLAGAGSFHVTAPISFDGSIPPPAAPTVTVTPSTNLPYRTEVTVHASGFGAGEEVEASFCVDSPDEGFCSGSGALADTSGATSFTIPVQRIVRGEGSSPIDCVDPANQCYVAVNGQFGYESVTVPVTFDPNAPIPPPPTATATPDRNLGYRQTVALAGANFVPGPVSVEECTTVSEPFGDFADCSAFGLATAAADGTLSGSFAVRKILTNGFAPATDCSQSVGKCFLRIGGDGVGGFGDFVDVPLGFDPASQPPPPPPVTVDPHTHLHDGQTVTVTGSQFSPNAQIGIAECKAGVLSLADCDITNPNLLGTDAHGAFSAHETVKAVLQTANGPVDCTAAAGACVLGVANTADFLEYSLTPLSFDAPELEVQSVAVTEGTGGVTAAPVRIELSEPAPAAIPVHWHAVPGTATASDYTASGGTVTIAKGATTATIPAEVVADALDEPTERFTVHVDSALGARVTDADATVKIRDDDPEVRATIHDGVAGEGDGFGRAEVLLSAPSGKTVIVHYVTHHLTARAGSDYVRKDSRLIFAPGQTRHVIRVALLDDHVRESTEQLRIELDDVDNGGIARGSATVTIRDDD